MVSSEAGNYRARLVRLIHGDINPAGPGFKARPVESPINGTYPGRRQPILIGSSIHVPSAPALERLQSFSITANIWPTSPGKGEQLLIGRYQPAAGFALVVGPAGDLALRIGEKLIATGCRLHGWTHPPKLAETAASSPEKCLRFARANPRFLI